MASVLTVIGLLILMTGCGEEASAETVEPVVEEATQVAEAVGEVPSDVIDLKNTVCPVMGLEVMEGQYIDWEGFRIHFCCAGCDETFLAAPEDFLPVLAEDEAVAARLAGEMPSCHTSGSGETGQYPSCGDAERVCEMPHEECSVCGETECVCPH